jgi:hypothetical protein
MEVDPNRLMTDEELKEWVHMVQELILPENKQGVIVGEPGYGSYRKYEGLFQFGLGLALKTTDLDSNGQELQAYSLDVPVAVREGDKRLGWLIGSQIMFPRLGQLTYAYEHSQSTLYWYNQARGKWKLTT